MARVWWLTLVFAALLSAQQQDSKQTPKQDQKTGDKSSADDGQKTGTEKYAEPQEEDESAKPSHIYTFNPLEAQSCVQVGNEYFKAGKYRPAIMRFQEATRWNTGYAEAYLRLGQASEKIKDFAGAKRAYSKYVELSPDAKNAAEIRKKIASLKN